MQRVGQSVILRDADSVQSPDWQAKQNASVERYSDESYNSNSAVPRLFGGFISVTLNKEDCVLDIGCGPSPKLPLYVDELGLKNYLGLEPLAAQVDREYPCIAGAIAEKMPVKDGSLDAAIFATSQDHIADIDAAMAETRRVVRRGGRIYMWIGLYDPEMLARARTFEATVKGGALRRMLAALTPVEYWLLRRRMADRAARLSSGRPIDNAHERWYTRPLLTQSLTRWGLKPDRSLLVPGTSSIFIEATNAS